MKASLVASSAAALAGASITWLVAACSSGPSNPYGYGYGAGGSYGYGFSLLRSIGPRTTRRT